MLCSIDPGAQGGAVWAKQNFGNWPTTFPAATLDSTRQTLGESYDQLMERYQTCDVLVFDDLGAKKLTDWVEEQFYVLVDYRYRQRLPVLASTNCLKEALAQRLDRRVLDRLRETCTLIEVSGPNQRDRGVQQRSVPGGR